jgi:hypothetical protein
MHPDWLKRVADRAMRYNLWQPVGTPGIIRRKQLEATLGWSLPEKIAQLADIYGNVGVGPVMLVITGDTDWGNALVDTRRLLSRTALGNGDYLVISNDQATHVIHRESSKVFEYIGSDGGFVLGNHLREFVDVEDLINWAINQKLGTKHATSDN